MKAKTKQMVPLEQLYFQYFGSKTINLWHVVKFNGNFYEDWVIDRIIEVLYLSNFDKINDWREAKGHFNRHYKRPKAPKKSRTYGERDKMGDLKSE